MLSGVRTEVRPGQDVGVSACSESTQPRMTATEAFSFAASFESIFISQSFISDFLSQRLLTELFESIVSPGLALPRFEIHPPFMQRCNSIQRYFSVPLQAPPTALPSVKD